MSTTSRAFTTNWSFQRMARLKRARAIPRKVVWQSSTTCPHENTLRTGVSGSRTHWNAGTFVARKNVPA